MVNQEQRRQRKKIEKTKNWKEQPEEETETLVTDRQRFDQIKKTANQAIR